MRVLLIAPPIMDVIDGELQVVGVDALRECPPLGIYALAAVLDAQGHEAVIADLILQGGRSLGAWEHELDTADLVGVGSTSMAWPTALDVIGQVRQRRPDVPIVCGGIHPTLFDRYILSAFPVQFVVRGEGETALGELCRALEGRLDLCDVPNLSWINPGGYLVRNPIDPMLRRGELAALPVPDFGRLPPTSYKCLGIESSRGCVYDCSFCSTPYRRTWRGLDAEVVVDRLERVLDRMDRTTSRCVHIVDDEFSLNPSRATGIAQLIRERGLTPRLLFDSRARDTAAPCVRVEHRAVHRRPSGGGRMRLRRRSGEGGERRYVQDARTGRESALRERHRGQDETSRSSSACRGRPRKRSSRPSVLPRTSSSSTACTS